MNHTYKRIKILSEAEVNDLYSLPKFTLEEKVSIYFSQTHENYLKAVSLDLKGFQGFSNSSVNNQFIFCKRHR
jgi:hypothetical protein